MRILVVVLLGVALACGTAAYAGPVVPDNGAGTAAMPLHADYQGQTPMYIRDGLPTYIVGGLPVASTITMNAVLTAPTATDEQAGGSLGGTQSLAAGSGFQWYMVGTGAMAGYSRDLLFPLAGSIGSFVSPLSGNASFEVHAAPRTPGTTPQSFDTTLFRLQGQLPVGDPDFDLLRITAGTDFGLPSPGHTKLTQLPGGNWAVDSFFDITYRIDFIGRDDGPFSGMSGSTTDTVRVQATPEPATLSLLALGGLALLRCRRGEACLARTLAGLPWARHASPLRSRATRNYSDSQK